MCQGCSPSVGACFALTPSAHPSPHSMTMSIKRSSIMLAILFAFLVSLCCNLCKAEEGYKETLGLGFQTQE